MSAKRKQELPITEQNVITPMAVMGYLHDHPNLFIDHPELLADMIIPHHVGAAGEAVSLVERQVAALREKNRQMQNQYREILAIARDNERLVRSLHRLTMNLIVTKLPEKFFVLIYESLVNDFRADVPAIRIFAKKPMKIERPEILTQEHPSHALFESVWRMGRPLCGPLTLNQHNALFDVQAEIGSCALIPISGKNWRGVMAIGSHNPKRFYPEMAVDLLSQLGEIASVLLDRWAGK